LIRGFTEEEKLLFEVAVIDALNNWPLEDCERLRSMLIKLGYDEQCARRAMRSSILDRIRATTLFDLLHPETGPDPQSDETTEETPPRDRKLARAANGSGATKGGSEQ
jgi:hypothetical protein